MTDIWTTDEASARFGSPALWQTPASRLILVEGDANVDLVVPPTFDAVVCTTAPFDSALARSVDAVGDPDEIRDSLESNPQASVTLAQLLRVSSHLDAVSGLVAESMAYSTLQAGGEFARWLSGRGRRVRPESDVSSLLVDETDGRVTITLNRPRLRNSFDARMRAELHEILVALSADDRVITLTGNGRAFCIGGDLAEFGTVSDPATAHQLRMAGNVAPLLAHMSDRITVDVFGASVGAGVEMAAFAGHIRATPDATFRLPEVTMGLVPGAGGTVSVPSRIGRQRTLWLVLADATLDVATALDWGLVDEITTK